MSVIDARYKVITFRISSNEYDHISSAAQLKGARSLSEFARRSVLERVRAERDVKREREQLRLMSEKLNELCNMLNDLQSKVAQQAEMNAHRVELDER